MKPVLFLSIVTFSGFMLSCNSNSNEKEQIEVRDTVHDSITAPVNKSTISAGNQSLLWHFEDTGSLKILKPKVPAIDTMSAKDVISLINNNNINNPIHIEYLRTSHDTVFVHIPDSKNLTERIGNTGAEMFMASTTFSLTEVKGINYVNYDFIEGEHAAPGVYDRSYFKSLE